VLPVVVRGPEGKKWFSVSMGTCRSWGIVFLVEVVAG
jgi:hypothetical protein